VKAGAVPPAFWLNNGENCACDMAFLTDSTLLCDNGMLKCVTSFSCFICDNLVAA
jgi:hypothetical protein